MAQRKKKTWREKREDPRPHEIKPVSIDLAGMKAGQIMLIATPRIVEDYLRAIPAGATREVKRMRSELAAQFGAEVTCPITTGIFLRIVAEAACEDLELGAQLSELAPFWRVIGENSPTAGKLSCGSAFIARQRAREAAENMGKSG